MGDSSLVVFECLPVVEIDTTVKPVKSWRLVEKNGWSYNKFCTCEFESGKVLHCSS